MKISEIKKSVLKKIRPSEKEKLEVDEFLLNLKEIARIYSNKYNAKPMICGSVGKGTWLSKNYDIDLFIVFPKNLPREKLESIGLDIGEKIINELGGSFIIKYAEHPYLRGKVSNYDIDIVPCYEMKFGEKIHSAVDRSTLHTLYMIEKLNDKKRDEILLLKKFSKSIGVYGSDAKTEGISGYILEILVTKFGTFENVLKFFSNSNFGEIVDVENYWNGKVPKKLIDGYPLVVIDPTDKYRNASAALNSQNFYLIKKYSKEFLNNPSEKFFFINEKKLLSSDIKKIKNRGTYFLGIISKRPDIIDDVIYPQLRRTSSRIESILEKHNFHVVRKLSWAGDKKMMIFLEVECKKLSNIEKRIGPCIFSKVHTRQFLSKYKDDVVYIEGKNWIVEKKREFTDPKDLLKSIISFDYKDMIEIGIASHIAESFCNAKILDEEKLWKFIKENLSKEIRKFYFGIL